MRRFLVTLVSGVAALAWAARDVGPSAQPPAPLTPAVRAEVEAGLRRFLGLERHLVASGGDPRFAQRLPAAPEVTDEVLASVRFARGQGWVESPELVRLEVLQARPLRTGLVELATREYWIVRARAVAGGADLGSPRAAVVTWRYVLLQQGEDWFVVSTGPAVEERPGGSAP